MEGVDGLEESESERESEVDVVGEVKVYIFLYGKSSRVSCHFTCEVARAKMDHALTRTSLVKDGGTSLLLISSF